MTTYDQQKHPELRPGEQWLTNIARGTNLRTSFRVRNGVAAYDINGNRVAGLIPVFKQPEKP